MKRLLRKFIPAKYLLSKQRRQLVEDFVAMLLEIPKANTEAEVLEGYQKVGEFAKRLDHNKKDDVWIREACGKLIEYLTDTKEHMNKGYHKPAHNGYKTVTVYPDINDYVNMGVRLKSF